MLIRIAVFLALHMLKNSDCFIITVCRYRQKEKKQPKEHTQNLKKGDPSALYFPGRGSPVNLNGIGKGESKAAPPFSYGAKGMGSHPYASLRME